MGLLPSKESSDEPSTKEDIAYLFHVALQKVIKCSAHFFKNALLGNVKVLFGHKRKIVHKNLLSLEKKAICHNLSTCHKKRHGSVLHFNNVRTYMY